MGNAFYPAIMIEYNFLSRNVRKPKKYKMIRDERIIMKANKDPRQQPRKIVLNGTFGASKDQYNKLYDPLMANNVCIAGQLLLVDLLDKLDGKCQLIQSNTDGILIKLYRDEDKDMILDICKTWCKRTRMELEFDMYKKVFQKDVNNYLIIPDGELYDKNGKERFKRKGAFVKKLGKLDNNLPIVNEAVVNYFTKGIPVEKTIMSCNELMKFQIITKVSGKYDYGFKVNSDKEKHTFSKNITDKKSTLGYKTIIETIYGLVLSEKVHRCFASKRQCDGTIMKKSKNKTSLDKVGGVPNKCFILNGDVTKTKVPQYLDKQWYVDLAESRIRDFLGVK